MAALATLVGEKVGEMVGWVSPSAVAALTGGDSGDHTDVADIIVEGEIPHACGGGAMTSEDDVAIEIDGHGGGIEGSNATCITELTN